MRLYLQILLLFTVQNVFSQLNFGEFNTPFSGVHGLKYNPAEIVDSRYKFHATLFGIGMSASNNYVGLSSDMVSLTPPNIVDSNRRILLPQNLDGKTKSAYAVMDIPSISLMYNFNQKHSIALSTGVKTFFTVNNLSELLARFAYDSKDTGTWKPSDNSGFGANGTAWAYIGLTYGRELINKKKNYLKAAITLKANLGLLNNAFQSDNLYVDVFNRDFARTANGTMNTYYSNAFYQNGKFQTPSFGFSNMGFGADLGLIYEKRDGKDYTYEMDCKTDNLRNDLNKYKYRIGISVVDFGQVAFNSSIPLSAVTFDSALFKTERFKRFQKPYDYQAFRDSLALIGVKIDTTPVNYSVWTPTRANFFFDYRVWKGLYVAVNGTLSFVLNNKTASMLNNSFVSIVPRWEGKAFGIYFPVQYHMLSKEVNVGAGLRLFCFNLAVQDWLIATGVKKQTKNFGFNFSVNIPIMNKKVPKDFDGDKISNKLDKCKDIPGDCDNMGCAPPDDDEDGIPNNQDKCPTKKGPLITSGCPDADNDGIIDSEDKCPKQAGPKEYGGCPDTDGDGLSDDIDKCPKEKGKKELDGCPDKDGDKVPDNVDKCPDVAGLIANNGCPEEKPKDTDADGIIDIEDDCPNEAGLKANKGCPVSEEKKAAKLAQENLEFFTGSSVIKKSSFNSLNIVAKILKENPSYKIKLEGHTDNVGKLEKNMKLSIDRAEAVKMFFMQKGIEGERISTIGYGPSVPKGDNDTEAGRTVNRRVDIEFITK
jgi:outer membrane protein OmpA-like peptidoglycan-associated protein